MMKYKCCVCGKLSDCLDYTIKHLRNDHGITDSSQKLECIVNNPCAKKYSNYKSLRKHVLQCTRSFDISKHVVASSEPVAISNEKPSALVIFGVYEFVDSF